MAKLVCAYAPTARAGTTRSRAAANGRNVERSARHAVADGGAWGTSSQRRSVRPTASGTYREEWFGRCLSHAETAGRVRQRRRIPRITEQ